MPKKNLTFSTPSGATLSAILQRPDTCRGLFVLGHGSGSNMHVPLISGLADALFERNIATLRFQYPYSEHPDFVPFSEMPVDDDDVLIETIRTIFDLAHEVAEGVPVFVGGHSISGFTTTLAAARSVLAARAIIVLAFPRKGEPSRSAHLSQVSCPVLIVQGTEDTLGTKPEITAMVKSFHGHVELAWIEGASHAFKVAGLEQAVVIQQVADHISIFVDGF